MSMRIPIAKCKRQTPEKGSLLQQPKRYKYKTKFSMIARTAMYIQQSAQEVCRLQGLKHCEQTGWNIKAYNKTGP